MVCPLVKKQAPNTHTMLYRLLPVLLVALPAHGDSNTKTVSLTVDGVRPVAETSDNYYCATMDCES